MDDCAVALFTAIVPFIEDGFLGAVVLEADAAGAAAGGGVGRGRVYEDGLFEVRVQQALELRGVVVGEHGVRGAAWLPKKGRALVQIDANTKLASLHSFQASVKVEADGSM